MTNNNTLKYRVGQLEGKVDKLDDKVDAVLQNHLPHMDVKLTRLAWLAGLNLFGIVLGLTLAKFL